MKKIITHSQKDEWTNYVEKSYHRDFYHSWIYHDLDKSGEAILYVYDDGEDFIAFPLIKRPISDTNLFDCSCVYGYSGPLSNKSFNQLSIVFMSKFRRSLLDYLKSENIVSVFARLHPLFDQNVLLEGFGGIYENGRVVVINLKESLEEQRAHYQMRWYRKIKRLKNKGFYLKQSRDTHDLSIFINIYRDNMRRVKASENYLFNEQYFLDLLNSNEIDCRLFLVYNNEDVPVSGGIMVFTQNVIQAHLLATLEEYLNDSPAKLLIDEVSIIARDMGMHYFNLGGGFGFKEDSLLEWKAKFSNFTPIYYTWRFIVDYIAYNEILWQRGVDPESSVDHFPLYRLRRENQLVVNN